MQKSLNFAVVRYRGPGDHQDFLSRQKRIAQVLGQPAYSPEPLRLFTAPVRRFKARYYRTPEPALQAL